MFLRAHASLVRRPTTSMVLGRVGCSDFYPQSYRNWPRAKSTFAKYDIEGEPGRMEGHGMSHFRRDRVTKKPENKTAEFVYDQHTYFPPMINHIWSQEEIEERKKNQPLVTPVTFSDKAVHFLVKKVLYRGFNFLSGFDYNNPTVKSCEFRLILLESIAGVPGMVAAVLRHFTSLRTLRRDHGWIHTLLEEAQNERMHLLVCMKKFDASLGTRMAVMGAQYVMVPFLTAVYLVHPKTLHRFVGYLEETAVKTYTDLLRITNTPGTRLNKAWSDMKAPGLAISYWNLKEDALWVDVLEQLLADESHHRDVNHQFADMEADEANPFLAEKVKDLEGVKNRGYKE